ncbi:MAG: exonuclease domain-containing protein [bacterium]|nr:exonuclease domain-containing protein [bacterium]
MTMDATDWSACDRGRSFAAIDFETATSERSSACAVGVVVFRQGSPVDGRRLLIRPPGNRYDAFNTALHGIGPSDTQDSPGFPEVWEQIAGILGGQLVVAHNTAFDMSVLRRSAEHYGYEPAPFPFACTYRLARSAMPEAPSWGLKALAGEFGIPLSHHDPLSDAQAAGHLWLALPERFKTTHPELLALHRYRLGRCDLSTYRPYSNAQPSSSRSSSSFSAKDFAPRAEPDPDGLLFAKKIAFTGTLECMPRREAFQAAVDAGAAPSMSVSKRTDYLVVGTTDLGKVGETGLSSKHRKALGLIADGREIRIIDEDQFICLLAGTVTRD